jgi:hypothetical protein
VVIEPKKKEIKAYQQPKTSRSKDIRHMDLSIGALVRVVVKRCNNNNNHVPHAQQTENGGSTLYAPNLIC